MSAWLPVFNTDTTREELEALIERWAQHTVADLRAQLEADHEIPAARRDAVCARLLPFCRAKTRETFEAGWRQLQADAAADETVH